MEQFQNNVISPRYPRMDTSVVPFFSWMDSSQFLFINIISRENYTISSAFIATLDKFNMNALFFAREL